MMDNSQVEKDAKLCTIRLKLKIPKNEERTMEIEDHQLNYVTSNNNSSNIIRRVCHICNRGFSSGKALGGHMRIHFLNTNKKDHLNILKSHNHQSMMINKFKKSPTKCVICGKDFPSMKSLFGHMRCHPERDWRGINPPSMAKTDSWFDANLTGTNEGHDKAADLVESFPAWTMTGRRGRRGQRVATSDLSSLGDDGLDLELQRAADTLMMMVGGEAANSNNSATFVDMDSKSDDAEKPASGLGVSVSKMEGQDQLQESMEELQINGSDSETPTSLKVLIKSRENLKLYDATRDDVSNPISQTDTAEMGSGSGQATISVGPRGEGGHTIWRMLKIDLNEVPQSEDEDGYECDFGVGKYDYASFCY